MSYCAERHTCAWASCNEVALDVGNSYVIQSACYLLACCVVPEHHPSESSSHAPDLQPGLNAI